MLRRKLVTILTFPSNLSFFTVKIKKKGKKERKENLLSSSGSSLPTQAFHPSEPVPADVPAGGDEWSVCHGVLWLIAAHAGHGGAQLCRP